MKPLWKPTADKPRFCRYCGTALEPNMTITGYNEFDGTPVTPPAHTPCCPNRRCQGKSRHWR